MPDTGAERERLIKLICIELCGGVDTTQRQRPMQISIRFCTHFISICVSLGLSVRQCTRTSAVTTCHVLRYSLSRVREIVAVYIDVNIFI